MRRGLVTDTISSGEKCSGRKASCLLELVGDEPVFESTLLLAGDVGPNHMRRQLSRWVRAGRVYQLRRGLYALARPFQKTCPHPFLVANRLRLGSYVSLQSALAFYGMIPEHVARVTSVTAARPAHWWTRLGEYIFRHVKAGLPKCSSPWAAKKRRPTKPCERLPGRTDPPQPRPHPDAQRGARILASAHSGSVAARRDNGSANRVSTSACCVKKTCRAC